MLFLVKAVDNEELETIKTFGAKFSMGSSSTYEFGKLFQKINKSVLLQLIWVL